MNLLNFQYRSVLLILFVGLFMSQCRKDDISTAVVPTPMVTYSNVSFLITVIGDDNQQIVASSVTIDGLSGSIAADENGIIIIENMDLPKSGVKAEFAAAG